MYIRYMLYEKGLVSVDPMNLVQLKACYLVPFKTTHIKLSSGRMIEESRRSLEVVIYLHK